MAQVQRKRMMWYYSAIADWMISNPGKPLYECAAHVGRTPATLSVIINSDLFKAYLAERKEQFRVAHDFGIIEKTTQVAVKGLDAILDQLEKKRDKIPIQELNQVTEGALKRLGYGIEPKGPAPVQINANNAQIVLPASVSPADLAEARMALRQVQESRAHLPQPSTPLQIEATMEELGVKELLIEEGAEPVEVVEGGADAPIIPGD